MKIATLHIHNHRIETTDLMPVSDDYFEVFYLPLSSLTGNKMHYYKSVFDEKLMADYNRYLAIQEGVYYAFSHDDLPIYLDDLPQEIDAVYNDGSFYFSHIHSQESFYFLYGYLMEIMLDYEQMANGVCAAFYVVFSHMTLTGVSA